MDKANYRRYKRAQKAKMKIKERRRFKVAAPSTGLSTASAPKDATTSLYTSTVRTPAPQQKVLTKGFDQVKLGGIVTVGDFAGYHVYGVTLEERATCPRTCSHWQTCYGNHMPFSKRWRHGPEFESALRLEIKTLLQKNPLLIRLHILGDFYSTRYVALWAKMLDDHPDLAAFGFTAWPPDSRIGAAVGRLRTAYPHRFAIRYSGQTGRWGSVTIDWPTEKRFIGDMVVCPEQLDANRDNPRGKHCGNCALCWQTDRGVVFIEH